jgi:hypothetical protein
MAAPTPRFMHFNKANIKCLLINILGHDIIHDYGPSMVDRWESNATIVTQFSADRFTMMGGRGMMGGMFNVSGNKRGSTIAFINPAAKIPKANSNSTREDWVTKTRMEQTTSQIYSQVRINEGIITDQIGNAMLFSFFGNVMYYLYLNQKITAAVGGGVINAQVAQVFYNSLPANVRLKIRTFIAKNYNIPAQNVQLPDAVFFALPAVIAPLINIARIFHEGLNIFDAQLFSLSDNMYQENFVNNGREIIPETIITSVEESFSLYVRTRAPGGAPFNQDLVYDPVGQPPYNLPAIIYTRFFELFDAFTKDNLSFTQPDQALNQAIVVIDGAGKIDGAIMNSYGLTPSNQVQFGDSLQPLRQQYPILNININALITMAKNPQVLNVGGKKNINQSGGADPALDRAQSEVLIDEIGLLLNSIVTINNNNNYSVANVNIANPANVNTNISIFREIVRQYNNYVASANDNAIQACVRLSMEPLVYNAGLLNVAGSGYYELIKLLRLQFDAIFLNVANIGALGARPPQPSKSAAMFNDYKMFSDIKRNKLRNLPDVSNFIKTFYLRISNLLDSYRVIVSKHIDSQRQAQARADADARKALLGELTDADKAVLGDFCTFMARAALTCTDIIDTSGVVKLPNVWSPENMIMPQPPPIKTFEWWRMQQQQVKSAKLTDYYTRKGLTAVAAQAALPPPFNNVVSWSAEIDAIITRRNVAPPLAAGGVINYYLNSAGVKQVGSQALAKETSILLYIAGYAGYGIIGNIDRNIISDTNYWLGWNDISSASLDDMLIQFIRDSVGAAYNFPAIEATDRILNATNMFCKPDSRKYIINNAAGSRPGNVKAHEFCPYSSILDGMSMCGWNSSNGSGRESGNMDFYYIGATNFSNVLAGGNLATAATKNTTSYYQGTSTLTENDQLLADDIAIQLNIRPNDNWPFPPIRVNVNTNISSNNILDAKVVLGTTLKTYITRIIGGTIQGAAVGAPPVVPAPVVVPSLDPGVLDAIFNTGTLLHSGMAANSTKSGIFTRLFQYYNDVQFAYAVAVAVAAGNAAAALPPAPLSAPSFANFYQDWVYGEITKKGIGDIFQEVNAMCKYGGYSLIRPNDAVGNAANAAYVGDRGTYRVSTERIISYLESPATQNTPINFTMPAQTNYTRIRANDNAAAPNPNGDQLRLFIAEDRPSGFRAGFVRKFGRQQDINNRASGGYYDGTDLGSFIVRPHNMNFCNIQAGVVFGGSKQNRKTRKHKKIVKTKKNMKMRKGRKTRIRGNPIKRMKMNVPRKRITKKVK